LLKLEMSASGKARLLRRAKGLQVNSRLVLAAGFGGLLVLMGFAELDGVRALAEIQANNDHIRDEFLLRMRVLERIRSDLYVSGTYVRDYLLEPVSGKAEGHLMSLIQAREDMSAELGTYRTLLTAEESRPFRILTDELAAYWKVLDPVFQWTKVQRQHAGYVFLRDEVFPRRTAMLSIADAIGTINQSQLNSGITRVAETFLRLRNRLTLATGLTSGLALLLTAFSIRKILMLERETAARYSEIAMARAELKLLSARLVEVQENERRSISRELHDEIGQALTGVLVEMANLSTLIRARRVEELEPKADEIKKLVENSIKVVRNMALLLRPSMLDDLGLVPALQWQARELTKRSGVRIKVAAEDVPEDLSEEYKTCIYRVVQEGLHNCIQHSGSLTVLVAVRQHSETLSLTIQDDGKGFNPQQERGMGLLGIQERVSHLGGDFSVDSEAGRGSVLRIVLPVMNTPVEANGTV
jgi:signal transduction histidine kinase